MGLYRSLEVVRRQAPRAIAVKQKVQDHANFHKGFDASPKFVVHCGKGMGQQKQSQQRIDSDALRSTGLELRRFAPFVEQMQGFCSSVFQVVRPFQLRDKALDHLKGCTVHVQDWQKLGRLHMKEATHHIYMHPVPHQAFHKRHAPICQHPIRVEVQAHAGLEQGKIFLAEDGLPARQECLCSEDLLVTRVCMVMCSHGYCC